MVGQMSLFDFMIPDIPNDIDLNTLPEEEMVQIVGNAVGIQFIYDNEYGRYRAKIKNAVYDIGYSNYALEDNHSRFISCGYNERLEGAGSPCNTIEEAVKFFKRQKRRKA